MRRWLLALVMIGCVTHQPDLSLRRGPRPRDMHVLADPFAGRRDVASTPAQTVFAHGCSAAIYAGPRACFVHLEHWLETPCTPIPDAGCVFVDVDPPPPNPASEYWLDCGEEASPCGQPVRCECAPMRD